MFKEPGDEGEQPGDTVDDVLDEQLGDEDHLLDDEGIDALLEVNGVGASSSSSASDSPSRSSTPPPTSSNNQPPKDAVTPQKRHQEAMMLMMQGKRHMLVKDLHSSVNAYQEACRIMDETHGQLAAPCGDAYLQYGQALLELARSENQVLGMEGGAPVEEEDDDDDDEEEEEGEEAEKEEEEEEPPEEDLEASAKEEVDGPSSSSSAKAKDKGKGLAVKKKTTTMPPPDSSDKKSADEEENDDDEEEKEEDENPDEEDVTNLQLAWEMLELAKLVFLKSPESKEKQIKAADCFLTLGEVSLESEAYDAAVDDFNKCLEIQKKNLDEDDRYIAETHYQLGLTHSFSKNYSDARLHFRHAIKVLESRIHNSKGILDAAIKETGSREKALKDEKVYKAKEEIEDLKELLPEILAKYEDAAEMEAEHSEASRAVKEASENLHRSPAKMQQPGTSAGSSTSGAATSSGTNGTGSSSSSSSSGAGPSASGASGSAASSSSALSSRFTAPFPRAEDEKSSSSSSNGVKKITFGSASSASSSAPAGVSMIGVRRNLNKGPASSASSSSSFSSSSFSSSSSSSSVPSGAVNDISSLVRRKRKPEEESNGTSTASALSSSSTNGFDAAASSSSNGASSSAANGVDSTAKTEEASPAVVNDVVNGVQNGKGTSPDAKRIKINGDA